MTIFDMLKSTTFLRSPDGEGGGGGEGGAGGGANPPWYQGVTGIDADTITHLTAKGWDKLTPTEVAVHAATAHRNAEKLIGAPADQMLRLPTDPAAPEWQTVYDRLGRPAKPDGYDFAGVKHANGNDLDPAFATSLATAAHKFGVSKDALAGLTKDIVAGLDARDAAAATAQAEAVAAERKTLETNWKADYSGNMALAKAAATKLGVTPEAVSALEGVIGYSKVMEMFRAIGQATGEDTFILTNKTPDGNPHTMSVDQATARKAELMKDNDWRQKYLAGGVNENKEMQALNKRILGQT